MPRIEMKVNPENLKFYIDKSEYDIDYLKEQRHLHNLPLWLDGEKNPTFNQLKSLSKKLRIPLAYLVVSEPHQEEVPLLEYRTVDSLDKGEASRELIDTIKNIKNRQEFVSDYKKEAGMDPLNYVGLFNLDSSTLEVVKFARELIGINSMWQKDIGKNEPLKYFRNKLSDVGTLIFFNGIVGSNTRRKLNIEEFRAFVLIDVYAPIIFINTNDSKNGQLFSLLHEFAHVLYGQDELYNAMDTRVHSVSKIEQKCNEFASEILVPNEVFKEMYSKKTSSLSKFIFDMANYFKVSQTVIARKALINGFIDGEKYEAIAEETYRNYIENEHRKKGKSGGHYWNTLQYKIDPTFFKSVSNSYHEGRTQLTDTLNILSVNRKGFEILEKAYEKGEEK